MAGRFTKGSLTISVIVGTVLVPLSALAALWLTSPGESSAESGTTPTSGPPVTTVAQVPETTPAGIAPADLQAACGPEGKQLIALEEHGTISDVQQAALDALRDLCDQQGLSLPARPTGEPIEQTVIVPATPAPTTVAATTAAAHDDEEDEDEDDHHEDDDYKDDDHEDDDHEDDDHEDDDYEDDDDHEEDD